jgi:hypothetical protein
MEMKSLQQQHQLALELMNKFTLRTGILPSKNGFLSEGKRYLWTDAFAVCNFIQLFKTTENREFLQIAEKLIDSVHQELGKFRSDDPIYQRRGNWISGDQNHPTQNGLRIGKRLPEISREFVSMIRGNDEEWERDGQYFHYLMKWTRALIKASQLTEFQHEKCKEYARFAKELVSGILPKFLNRDQDLLYWKMNTDLSHPLVLSQGLFDPLDGYITFEEISLLGNFRDLKVFSDKLEKLTKGKKWTTRDELGLGGLLCDCFRLFQMLEIKSKSSDFDREDVQFDRDLLICLLKDGLTSLKELCKEKYHLIPAENRLAFREIGLSLGFLAIFRLKNSVNPSFSFDDPFQRQVAHYVDLILNYSDIGQTITNYWSLEEHRLSETWLEHQDINEVMMSTLFLSDEFLVL